MSNARTEAAAAGYQYFLQPGGPRSLEEVNLFLLSHGHTPISQRMHDHYRKLQRYAVSDYMPINQLDVWAARHRAA